MRKLIFLLFMLTVSPTMAQADLDAYKGSFKEEKTFTLEFNIIDTINLNAIETENGYDEVKNAEIF